MLTLCSLGIFGDMEGSIAMQHGQVSLLVKNIEIRPMASFLCYCIPKIGDQPVL